MIGGENVTLNRQLSMETERAKIIYFFGLFEITNMRIFHLFNLKLPILVLLIMFSQLRNLSITAQPLATTVYGAADDITKETVTFFRFTHKIVNFLLHSVQ